MGWKFWCVCVRQRMRGTKKGASKEKEGEEKNVTKPFPLNELDYFLRVGTRYGRANPGCYRGTGP